MTALGGHINHVFEDYILRFKDIKEIFKLIGNGNIETYEKVDGQSLFISWDLVANKLIVARNKQNIKDGGLDRYGLSLKFGDRPEVEKLFLGAYDTLSKLFEQIKDDDKWQIFGSLGNIWYPVEIVNPDFPNTIIYNSRYILFHEYDPVLFGMDGDPLTTALPRQFQMMKKFLSSSEPVDGWCVLPPKKFGVPEISESLIERHCQKIDHFCKLNKISDSTMIREYISKALMNEMSKYNFIPESIRFNVARKIAKFPSAPKISESIRPLDSEIRKHANKMVQEARKEFLPKIMAPVEALVFRFSSDFLSHVASDYITDVQSEAKRLKVEYERCCDILRNSPDTKDYEFVNATKKKIGNDSITIEGLIFKYRNKIYKITGAFAPMNRVIAKIKYERYKKVENPTNKSLAYSIQGG